MAYTDLYDDEKLRALMGLAPPTQSAAAPAPGGGAALAPPPAPPPGTGSGFVNLDRVFGLNAAPAAQLGADVAGRVNAAGEAAQDAQRRYLASNPFRTEGDKGVAAVTQQTADAAAQARLAAGPGLSTVLGGMYGRGGEYTSGQRGMDAFLAGQTAGDQLRGARNRFGGIDKAWGLALAGRPAYTPPTPPAGGGGGPPPGGIGAEGGDGRHPGLPVLGPATLSDEEERRRRAREARVDTRSRPDPLRTFNPFTAGRL